METIVVWDFDWSMADENSDTWLVKWFDTDLHSSMRKKDMKQRFPVWTDLMQECFRILQHEKGVTSSSFNECIQSLPMHPSVLRLVRQLFQEGVQQYIVSDANTVFINQVLSHHKLDHIFPSNRIYTNPGYYNEQGDLIVSWYHPADRPHACEKCSRNICKSEIIREFREAQHRIVYVGDGRGDFCPSLNMNENDLVMARKDYPLHCLLKESQSQVPFIAWSDGDDLLREITRFIKSS